MSKGKYIEVQVECDMAYLLHSTAPIYEAQFFIKNACDDF